MGDNHTNSNKAEETNNVAAESLTKSNPTGGWFSWYNDAKTKTLSTLDMVKRDLNEFGDAVGQQAASTMDAVVGQTPQDLGAKAGRWIKQLAGAVNDTVLQMADTTQNEQADEVPVVGVQLSSPIHGQDKLTSIQADPSTFLDEPSGVPELFEDWLDHFDLSNRKIEINELLTTSSPLRKNYAELVPLKLQNSVFWQRYFYKVHQLELDQAKISNFLQKTTNDDKKERLDMKSSSDVDSWGDDSDFDDVTVVAEKCLGPDIKTIGHVPEDLDETTTTAVLEMEDKRQQQSKGPKQQKPPAGHNGAKTTSKKESRDGAGVVDKKSAKMTPQSERKDGAGIADEKSIISSPTESMTSSAISLLNENNDGETVENEDYVNKDGVKSDGTAIDEEVRSENSFCVVKSADSSDA